ncbi:pyrroloquinoline quinone precursor peptide PqqA [Noviherbaspirillum pedocola]|nr:pyrroloquinoline quinone precursor peptide PqqA [Noviherbaspirillum pedocola]
MISRLRPARSDGQNGLVRVIQRGHSIQRSEENSMTWETPQAIDMRWGFEITMYIANR